MSKGLCFWRRLLPICLLLFLVLISTAQAEVVRVMPLGDSITYGTWGNGDTRSAEMTTGYRQALFLALQKAGHQVEFVGTLSAGGSATPAFDPRHEGHRGWRDDQVAANIFAWLSAHPAEIVLLHIGTNSLTSSPSDVENILREIDRFSSDTIVVLARIINRKNYSALSTQFNDNVEAMAQERIRNGDRIVLVNMEDALDYSKDMFDDLHPNQAGYEKMAKVWLAALLELLPLPTPVHLTPMPTINAWTGQYLRLQLQATGSPAPFFSLLNPPTGMTIDQQSGLLSWRPTKVESRNLSVQAQNIAASDRLELKLKVREAPLCPETLTALWPLDEELAPYFELFHRTPPGACAGQCPTPIAGSIDTGQALAEGKGIDLSLGVQSQAGTFSLSLWMRRPATPHSSEHLLGGESGSERWSIELTGEGLAQLIWQAPGKTPVQVIGASPLDDGDWHHLLAAFDFASGVMHLYVDGELNGTASGLPGSVAAISVLHLGRSSKTWVKDFAGELDEVALFDDSLAHTIVERIYTRGAVSLGVCRYEQELPKITSTPSSLRGTVGKEWSYQLTATGLPQPIFALPQGPTGMSISVDSGKVLWKPSSAGSFPVTIRASNMNGQAEQKFTLDIEPPPAPPEFRSMAPGKVVVATDYLYSIEVDGYPAPILTLTSAPNGMTLKGNLLSWTPAVTGSYAVILQGANASGKAEQAFTILVEPPPAPPRIGSTPMLTATAGLPYLYPVKVSGYPQPHLRLITAPEGMIADSEQLRWTPAAPGFYTVELEAINEVGRAQQSFTIQVEPPPQPPRIVSVPPLVAFLRQDYSYQVRSEGYPPPEVTLLSPIPPGMSFDKDACRLHGRPTIAGRYPVHLRAQSSAGAADQDFILEVPAQRSWHGRLDDWWRKAKKRWRKWF